MSREAILRRDIEFVEQIIKMASKHGIDNEHPFYIYLQDLKRILEDDLPDTRERGRIR